MYLCRNTSVIARCCLFVFLHTIAIYCITHPFNDFPCCSVFGIHRCTILTKWMFCGKFMVYNTLCSGLHLSIIGPCFGMLIDICRL